MKMWVELWVEVFRVFPANPTVVRFLNDLQVRGDCLSTRKSCKTHHFVGWAVG